MNYGMNEACGQAANPYGSDKIMAAAQAQPPVSRSLEGLLKVIAVSHEELEMLSNRLHSVTQPVPEKETGGPTPPPSCEIEGRIIDAVTSIDRLRSRIRYLRESLCI